MADFNSFFLAIAGALFGFGSSPKPATVERAVATLYTDAAGRALKPPVRLVLRGDEAEQLAGFFPVRGESRTGSKPATAKIAEIVFERNDGTGTWIRLGHGYGSWSDGTNDRTARPGLWDFLKRRSG